MKYQTILALACALVANAAAASNIFQATDEWQVVPDDYEIPGGLHVRMNFETGEKQAKLPDPDEDDKANEAVVFEGDGSVAKHAPKKENKQTVLQEQDVLLKETLDQMALGNYGKLEEVEEWAHDVEYGEKIANSPNFLTELINLVVTPSQPIAHREVAARIFGATFKSNPAALDQLLPNHDPIVGELLKSVKDTKDDKLQSRLVYALGSLITDDRAWQKFELHQGDLALQTVFKDAPLAIKTKIAVLIEKLVGKAHRESVNKEWSSLFQDTLSTAKVKADDDLVPLLETLTSIHEQAAKLPVDKQFLKWISSKASEKGESSQLVELAQNARHKVFGNPNAQRKEDYRDEL